MFTIQNTKKTSGVYRYQLGVRVYAAQTVISII